MRRTHAYTLAALLAASGTTAVHAEPFTYNNFSSPSNLTTSGNTTVVGNELRLTGAGNAQAGAAYSSVPTMLGTGNSFATQFQFQFLNQGGTAPADGMAFVIAANPTGLGAPGYGIGYAGVNHSVGIEFDTYNNGASDGNSSNHIGVDVNGSLNSAALSYVYGVQTCDFGAATNYKNSGCMSNGNIWTATITYDGTYLNASLFDPGRGAAFAAINNYAIDIGSILGTNRAYVGFTASTGNGYETHSILNWTFADAARLPDPTPDPIPDPTPIDNTPPTSVPEPATLSLMGLGLIGAMFSRRRR